MRTMVARPADGLRHIGEAFSQLANAGRISAIEERSRPRRRATSCHRLVASVTSARAAAASLGSRRKNSATPRRSSMLAALDLPSIEVLRYFGPGSGFGLMSNAGESAQPPAVVRRKPWLRRWSSVLLTRIEKAIRRQ